jgi:phosphoglycerate kinase
MAIKYINELDIKEKKVFLRLDLNVPIKEGKITDDTRIRAALPTINFALEKKAAIIMASHLGRPKGKRDEKYTLRPVAARLAEILGKDVIFPEDCVGDAVKKLAFDLRPGEVMLLENLRFHKEEEEGDAKFAEMLGRLAEVYVNDAFGAIHRPHASIVGITNYVYQKGAGFLIKKELEFLGQLLSSPERPFVAVLGGAKVSDKIGVIQNLISKVDAMVIGGAMAYTFLKAKGYEIGNSLFEPDHLYTASEILKRAEVRGVEMLLPEDHVVAKEAKEGVSYSHTDDVNIPMGMVGLDIGEKTIKRFKERISASRTVFWNGPMGMFEVPPFDRGTVELAKAVASSNLISVIGGGDTVAAIAKAGVEDRISHISTGGGASLEFLEGKRLPGLVALEL